MYIKKQIVVSIGAFILGALVVHVMTFGVHDVRTFSPSSEDPLTDEGFANAQSEGGCNFLWGSFKW